MEIELNNNIKNNKVKTGDVIVSFNGDIKVGDSVKYHLIVRKTDGYGRDGFGVMNLKTCVLIDDVHGENIESLLNNFKKHYSNREIIEIIPTESIKLFREP